MGITDVDYRAWIGLYYDKQLDPSENNSIKWRWTDKHPVSYTSWAQNEPQTGNSDQEFCNSFEFKKQTSI